MGKPNWTNKTVFVGDNLHVMRGMNSESVDLIYLDPPFNSNKDYAAPVGSKAAEAAFKDTWALADVDVIEHDVFRDQERGLYSVIATAKETHSKGMFSYLLMMAVRLMELRRILKPTGSIYLHCDPTASHYLKLLMDAIFGYRDFRNEIIWRRYDRPKGSQHKSRRYGRSSDTLLFYSMGSNHIFNAEEIRIPLKQDGIEKRFPGVDDKGRFMSGPLIRSPSMGDRPNLVFEFQGYTPDAFGWRMGRGKLQEIYDRGDFYFTSNGVPRRKFRPKDMPGEIVGNVWVDINALGSHDHERLGYPTQKPLALLDRIIKASSNEGDVVFDPFCGCATTMVSADSLGRDWVGCDLSQKAVDLVVDRIKEAKGLWGDIVARETLPQRTDKGDELSASGKRDYKQTLYGKQGGGCQGCEMHFHPNMLEMGIM